MYKLGTLVADSACMSVTGNYLIKQHQIMDEQIKQSDYSMLDLMHHFTSGLKALYSQMCY